MKHRSYNVFDIFIISLVVCLAFGGITGSGLTPVRALTLLLCPSMLLRLGNPSYNYVRPIFYLFVFWYMWGCFSMLWTPDKTAGFKAMVYMPMHFMLFLEIIVFARKAVNPLRSLVLGYSLSFFFTSLIAGWELVTNNHLEMAKFQSDFSALDRFGQRVNVLTASATFGNYNSYVTYICMCLPFLFKSVYDCHKVNLNSLAKIGLLLFSEAIIFINGSRGGVLSVIGCSLIYLFFSRKQKNIVNKYIIISLVICVCTALYYFGDIIMLRIAGRIAHGAGNLSNTPRLTVWANAFHVLSQYMYLGTGLNGIMAAMCNYIGPNNILITHNMLLEILVESGVLISAFVFFALFKLVYMTFQVSDISRKMVLRCAVLTFPFYSIIDSSYMYNPVTFLFFASVFVFTYYERIRYNC